MPGKYKQQRSIRTREDLLDVVADEIVRLGYAGTNLQRVVERLNLTKGALYGHFSSKAEAAAALLREFWAEFAEIFGDGRDAAGSGAAVGQARITLLFDRAAESVRTAAALRMLTEEAQAKSATLPELSAIRATVRAHVQYAQNTGELGSQISADEVVDLVLAVLAGSRPAEVTFGSDDPSAQIRRLWSLLPPEPG